MRRSFIGLVSTLVVLAVCSLMAFGQTTSTGSLSGTVMDPTGAVVPNASVTLKSVAGQEFTVQTNDNGTFQIPSLAAGTYTATITGAGFKKSEVTGIKIDVGKPSDIKVTMEIGSASEVVTVVGGGELLQTQTATVGTTITGRQITELPYASRNALDLLLFLPGTSTAGRPRQSTVNGLPKSMLNITLDGLNIQDNVLKGSDGFFTLIQPKTDAVAEVTVSTSTPGAESNAEGAVQIKFTTRSGSSEFHGSLYESHRDKSLNSNFFWNNELLAPKPHFGKASSPSDRAPRTNALLNQPGGRIGGPIKIPYIFNDTRKGFFFVNYEEYRLPEAQLRSRTVLSPNAVAGLFTFGSTTVNLYTLAAANGFTSTPDPTILALLASTRAVPGSYTPSSDPNIQLLSFTNQGGQKRRFPTVRFDFEVNKNNHIETIYNYQIFRSKVDFLNNADPFAPGFPNFGSQDSNRYSSSTAWRTTIKQNLVNEARFGVQNGIVLFFPQNNPGQFVNQGGVAQGINVAAAGISNVTTVNNAQRRNTPTYQMSDNLSYVRGNHSMSFGGDVSSISTFLAQTPNFVGVVPTAGYGQDASDPIENIFCVPGSSANTCGPFTNATVAAQADTLYRVLTGRLTSLSYAASLNQAGTGYVRDLNIQRFRQREFGLYAQDSWRFRPNLTINFGLRLETVYAPISRNKALTQNTFAGLFGTSGSDLNALFKPGASGGSATQFTPLPPGQHLFNTAHNLGPTIGFAYQPDFKHGFLRRLTGDAGQTVIRGGWSMAFSREGLNLTSSIVGTNFGGQIDLTQFAGATTGFPRGTLFRNLPAPPATPGVPAYPLTPGFSDNASANGFLPNLKTPYVISYSGSIQREITKDMVLEIGYIGNRGHQLLRQFNVNEVNIIENGFAAEFDNARRNLAINVAGGCGTTFRLSTCAGTVPLPLFLAFFQGSSANANLPATYTSSRFASATFTSRMVPSNLQALGTAGILAQRVQVAANGNPYMANANAAGLPSNFFVVNPVQFNNFGAGNGSFLVNNDGKTWYDAMTIELRRRMSKGILASFNYTFAKALGNEYVSSSIAFLQPATIRNTWRNKVASPFDIQQSLKGSFIVEMPVGQGRHFLGNSHGIVNGFLGNWTINGTLRISSGVPVNLGNVQLVGMTAKELQNAIQIRKTADRKVFWLPQDIVDNSRRAFNTCVPNTAGCDANGYGTAALSGGITGGSPTGKYFAPAGLNCISRSTGDCGFTQLIVKGPHFTRADIGIAKKIKFTETKNFEFRFEFLNAFNSINFRLGSYNADVVNIGGANADIPTYTLSTFGQLLGSNTAYRDVSTTNDPGGRVGQIVVRFNF